MAVDVNVTELKLVRFGDSMEIDLLALQGLWTEEQYLAITDHTNSLVEYTDGAIEILPVPTDRHQSIVQFMLYALVAFVGRSGGKVQVAPLRMRVRARKFREPDLLLVLDRKDQRRQNRYWLGADLVVEIVSPDDPERDTVEKRVDYAEARIPEYWIVNPEDDTVTVLTLVGESYVEHGIFTRGQTADSVLLQGFAVEVDEVLDAE